MPLSFKPACLPVAYGELPHTNAAQALRLLLDTTPAVVTCAALPQRGFREHAYIQSILGFPGLVLDQHSKRAYVNRTEALPKLDQLALAYLQNHVAFAALTSDALPLLTELRRLRGVFAGQAIKIIVTGPISLSLQLTDDQQRPLAYDAMLFEALAQHLTLRAAWQVSQLIDLGVDIVVCLDEPFLDAFASPFCPIEWNDAAALLELLLSSIRGCRGILTSGPVDWAMVLQTSVEWVHFNAYQYSQALLDSAEVLATFLKRPGFLTWGIVPTSVGDLRRETIETLTERIEHILDRLVAVGIPREQMLQAMLISTTTGLAHMSVSDAEKALTLCAGISAHLREKYDLNA